MSALLYSAVMAFESLTVAQLETMRDDLLTGIAKASAGAVEYNIGSRGLKRASLTELTNTLNLVSRELAARADQSGGVGLVEFGEPQ